MSQIKPSNTIIGLLMATLAASAMAREFAPDPYADAIHQHQIDQAFELAVTPQFSVLDRNDDNQIEPSEAEGDALLSKRFREFDRDDDGRISHAEHRAYLGFVDQRNRR